MTSETALRNSLVLRQIFMHIPTSLLLPSCSLVNKIWRKEALRCFRNRRNYAPLKSEPMTDCKFIQKLDQICCQMAEESGVIWWNALKLTLDPVTCQKNHSNDEKIQLRSPLKVKYLDIFWGGADNIPDCSIHEPLQALLRPNSTHLLGLKVTNLPSNFLNRVLSDSFSGFPKLEKITISTGPKFDLTFRTQLNQQQTDAVGRLLRSAPNLKRIAVNDVQSLRMVPEESYRLLETLQFCFMSVQDESLFQIVAEKRPNLRKLRISQSNLYFLAGLLVHVNHLEDVFNRSLERLLASCHQTLEKLEVASPYSLIHLSFPALVHLRELKLVHKFGSRDKFFENFIFLDYADKMPNLKTLELNMVSLLHEKFQRGSYNDGNMQDRVNGNGRSIQELTVVLRAPRMDLTLLKTLFPNVLSLNIRINEGISQVGRRGYIPILETCQLWPNLQELAISGADNFQALNYDAYFCGIFEEEAHMLRGMDADYLRAVHIVPIRHGMLTMPDLRKLRIDFGASGGSPRSEVCLSLTSNVTDLVAFQRMPGMQVSIVGAFSMLLCYFDDE